MLETSQDIRVELLNQLLTTPHRDLNSLQPLHDKILKEDPLFYLHVAPWYSKNGVIKDSKELFSANLCMHPDKDFREVGLALLEEFPPYQVQRTVDHVHKVKKNIPNSMRTSVKNYLKAREEKPEFFDSAVLHARKSMKRLYALLHISPSERANLILFKNSPPEDSDAFLVKKLAKTSDPSEQARVIIENKIPYRVASSVVKKMTPTVLLALIEVMSPQELINSMGSLQRHGIFDNPDLKKVVEAKLKLVEGSKKISTLKSMVAAKSAGLSDDLNDQLNAIADHQIKSGVRITRPTALLIDKSQSMYASIEIGKQMGSIISSAMAEGVPLFCYAFDIMPYEIKPKGTAIADWAEALKYVTASGCTCCGAPMVALKNNKQKVESIVMISDEAENRAPAFLKSYEDYCLTMNVKPSVYMIRCGEFRNDISDKLERAGVELSKIDVRSGADYYSLPQIVTQLAKPSKLELLLEIMNFKLPKRKTASTPPKSKKIDEVPVAL